MRILVVEDYGPLRESLRQGIQEAGFAVDVSAEGEEGLWYAQSNDYDAIVLDIMLPRMDGVTIVRRLRAAGSHTPILLLTARDTIEDRVLGLDSGADDYLTKPFAFDELLARLRVMTRRKYDKPAPILRIEDLELDTARRAVRRAGRDIDLTAREYALLEFLMHRAGDVVSRADIWEHLYEFNSTADSNVVDVYIGYLRRKLEGPALPRLIHTRRGQGYRLGSGD